MWLFVSRNFCSIPAGSHYITISLCCSFGSGSALERDDFNWEYVENAGLVRDSLQFKRNMLSEMIKEGVVARLVKIINSILGSLAIFRSWKP